MFQQNVFVQKKPFFFLVCSSVVMGVFYSLLCPFVWSFPLLLFLFSLIETLFYQTHRLLFPIALFMSVLICGFLLAHRESLLFSLLFSFPLGLISFGLGSSVKKETVASVTCTLAEEERNRYEELLQERVRQLEECRRNIESHKSESEKLKQLLELHMLNAEDRRSEHQSETIEEVSVNNSPKPEVHAIDTQLKEYQALYSQLKEQHAHVRQELETARHSSFLEQLRADTLERQVEEMDLQLTESSCSDLMKLIKQYCEEYTQLVVTHHRDMVEYEQMIQSLFVELERSSKRIAVLEKR